MSAPGVAATDAAVRRALWRCRRGMKELDLLLERYARTHLARASAEERAQFEELLGLPDPVLSGYLLGGVNPRTPALGHLVARIRAYVA